MGSYHEKFRSRKNVLHFLEKTIAFHSDQLQWIGNDICATRDRFIYSVRAILTAVFNGMQNSCIAKEAKDDLTMTKVFRHKYSDPEVHKSSSLKKKWKKTKHSDADLKFGMKYIEKFNPLTRTIEDGFPDFSFSFCRNIHFIRKSLIDGKLVSWVINEKLIPGYNAETKKYDPAYNPPTGEVFPFTVDFIRV